MKGRREKKEKRKGKLRRLDPKEGPAVNLEEPWMATGTN